MPRSARKAAAASLVCVAGFALVVLFALAVQTLQTADARVLSWFAAYDHTALGSVAGVFTFFGDPLPFLIIVGLLCAYGVRQGRVAEAAAALTVVAGASLTTQLFKQGLSHGRIQTLLGEHGHLWTFPSGHVTAAASLVLAAAWVASPRWRRAVLAWGSLFVLAVGISVLVRVWHFPSDAIGGVLVALGWGFGVLAVYLSLPPRLRRLSGRRSAPPRGAGRTAVSTK